MEDCVDVELPKCHFLRRRAGYCVEVGLVIPTFLRVIEDAMKQVVLYILPGQWLRVILLQRKAGVSRADSCTLQQSAG